MKKLLFVLMIAVTMSFAGFNASAAPAPKQSAANPVEAIWKSLPEVLVVKQVATLGDGRAVTVFYKKAGDRCEVYSPDNLKGYTIADLSGLKKSEFAITTSAQGKMIYSAPISKVRRIIKNAVARYL